MKKLNWMILAAVSAASVGLRLWQNATGYDAAGLPLRGGIPGVALPLLLVLSAVYFVYDAHGLSRRSDHSVSAGGFFRFSGMPALTAAVAGVFLVLLAAVGELVGLGGSQTVLAAAGAVGALCALWTLFALRREREPEGLAMLVPVCCLLVYIIFRYRADAANPTLSHIYVELLAAAALTVSWLERAAFAFRNGSPQIYVAVNQIAVVLAFTAAADHRTPAATLFFLGSALTELGFLSAAAAGAPRD